MSAYGREAVQAQQNYCADCAQYDPTGDHADPAYKPPASCFCAEKWAVTDANRKACLKGSKRRTAAKGEE